MYALIENGEVKQYPYGADVLRRDNPQTSFPKNPSDQMLAEWGVYPLTTVPVPEIDHSKNVVEGTPKLIDGQWTQVWNVTDATAEEIQQRTDDKATDVRHERNRKLSDCDWTQGKDISNDVSNIWAIYRQELRDIPEQAGFPWNITWPQKPE